MNENPVEYLIELKACCRLISEKIAYSSPDVVAIESIANEAADLCAKIIAWSQGQAART